MIPTVATIRAAALSLALASCYEPPATCYRLLSCPSPDADIQDFFPIVSDVFPKDDERAVSHDVIVRARFTEHVTGISASTFTLRREDGSAAIAAVVAYDPETRTAWLVPGSLLTASSTYVAVLGPEIVDPSGKVLVGKTSWSFSTAHDSAPPMVAQTAPAAGAVGVALDTVLVATFSEQVSHVTGASFLLEDERGFVSGTIGYVSQTAVSLTPDQPLAPNTQYQVTLTTVITDLATNQLANAPVTWTFTTGADPIAPAFHDRVARVDSSGAR